MLWKLAVTKSVVSAGRPQPQAIYIAGEGGLISIQVESGARWFDTMEIEDFERVLDGRGRTVFEMFLNLITGRMSRPYPGCSTLSIIGFCA